MPVNEIQFYRDKMFSIVDRMIQTRPKKEVVYRPFTQQPYQQKDISRCQTGNLNEIFGKTWAGDYAYVTTLIKSPCDAEIALTFRGATEYRLNGGEWVKKSEENPFAMHEQFRDKVKVHEGYNELVLKVVCGDTNCMSFSYLVAPAAYPGRGSNDYVICLHDTLPVPEFKDEYGYAVSELCERNTVKSYEQCQTVYPKPSKSDRLIDFNLLYGEQKGDWAVAYTTVKRDTPLSIKTKCPVTVYVNGVKSKPKTNLRQGDKLCLLVKRKKGEWGFESEINDSVFPSEIQTQRNDGVHWLLLGPFAQDACPQIDFKSPYTTADGGQCYFRFADKNTYLRPFLETFFYGQWFYALMVGQYGIRRASMLDKKYYHYFRDGIKILVDYYDYMQYDYTLFTDIPFLRQCINISCFDASGTMAMNMCDLYLDETDEEYKKKILRMIKCLTEQAMTKIFRLEDGTFYRKHNMTLWADDTFMCNPFLVRVGKVTGDTKYYDEVVKQLKLYTQKLFMKDQGIFAHIYYPNLKRHNSVPWGRGNGWVYLAFAEVIENLPEGYPGRDDLIEIYKEMMRGVVPYQAESGLWHQVLNIPESYEETSCTAIFSISFAKMIKAGVLDKTEMLPVIKKALDGLLKHSVDENNNVLGVCKGSSCKDGPEYYINLQTVFNDDHGTGMVIYALCELIDLLNED